MNRERIPDELRRFILADIPSVPFLEAMLLLRREAGRAWESRLLARELYVDDAVARALLDELHSAGILVKDHGKPPAFRYGPSPESLRRMIDLLAECYSRHLVEISNLIHAKRGKSGTREQSAADAVKGQKNS
ncbi:MAG TPA: hypothetical protein VJ698_07575 [Noviherbaspirillum sp.]|uniref:hypothetical protein n=1 Tax=Noviherbaspirillum sp. TaxID=1926288 RepID=UPI002B49DB4A|nr:hypothetical protein [Noviherbaspirillum sp.]HJV85322.1 hypothetical protein [Noviherbaspirillum sp.]